MLPTEISEMKKPPARTYPRKGLLRSDTYIITEKGLKHNTYSHGYGYDCNEDKVLDFCVGVTEKIRKNMKIKDLPVADRPREKLIAKGVENLKDAELLAILLRTGTTGKNAIEIASQILSKYSKKRLLQMTHEDLCKIDGIDSAKAAMLLGAFELSKRALEVNDTDLPMIETAKDVVAQLMDIRDLKKEHFVVLYLNAKNQLVHKETIAMGTLNANLVHPREVFEPALKCCAAQIVVAHNHPSGDPKPSEDDIELTKRLSEAGTMMGIDLMDYLIVSKSGHFSFKEEKII